MRKFLSIQWKFLVVCLVFITVPTVVLGFLVYRTYYKEISLNTRRDLSLIANGWRTVAEVYREELERILKREENLVEKRLTSITLDVRKMVEFYDEIFGLEKDEKRFQALLDKIAQIKIGRSGYVAILDGQGKYVLSHGRKYDGLKVFDFKQAQPLASYQAIISEARQLKGEEVKVFHYKWTDPGFPDPRMKVAAITYLPGRDLFIAASAYYTDFRSYELERILREELKTRMARQKIGARGYMFILDKQGTFVVSKDRLRDGENIYDYRDREGFFLVQNILRRSAALKGDESFWIEYWWKNLDDHIVYRHMAAIVRDPGWDWVIGATVYEEDVIQGLEVIRWQITFFCLLFILLGTIVSFIFSIHITRPIRNLENIASMGDLNVAMDPEVLALNDEIGNLGLAFEGMMKNLRDKIAELERSRGELLAKNEALREAQQQLVQSEKLAAIGQLAAGVAHEINNPLGYVMSNMETLEQYIHAYEEVLRDVEEMGYDQDSWQSLEDVKSEMKMRTRRLREAKFGHIRTDIQSMIPELRDGLSRVKRIVMDLRIHARAEQEHKVKVNIEDLLEQAVTIVKSQIKHPVELVREYSPLPLINCHAQRICQVFINIILNAVQAAEPGTGRTHLRTLADSQWVYVEISDNGSGISPENMSKLFEPFFTTKPIGQGTGLGLSISYEIIKKHGGEIRVRSQIGAGTTFTVMLPIRDLAVSDAVVNRPV